MNKLGLGVNSDSVKKKIEKKVDRNHNPIQRHEPFTKRLIDAAGS